MSDSNWLTTIRIIGIVIMLFSFAVIPDDYPWYYEILLFDVGLLMMMYAKSQSFEKA